MGNNIIKSLELMIMGMVGIFVVLILIYIVIYLLNNYTNNEVDTKATSKENEKVESVSIVDNTDEEIVCAIVEAVICEELHIEPDKLQIIEINEK